MFRVINLDMHQTMQLLLLIKKILPTSLVVPCLLFADPIGDIVEQTGKGALTRNNEEFVAVVGRMFYYMTLTPATDE